MWHSLGTSIGVPRHRVPLVLAHGSTYSKRTPLQVVTWTSHTPQCLVDDRHLLVLAMYGAEVGQWISLFDTRVDTNNEYVHTTEVLGTPSHSAVILSLMLNGRPTTSDNVRPSLE